jgi:dihydrofolate reductase
MKRTEERFKIIIIAALSEDHVIGVNNTLPWSIPEDLRRFKEITTGHTVIMGRKTFESIGMALPNRHNIVLSNTLLSNQVKVAGSLEEAFNSVLEGENKVFIIGGQRVYEDTIDIADEMYLTVVEGTYKGDAYFPNFDEDDWHIVVAESHKDFQFVSLGRIKNESSIK